VTRFAAALALVAALLFRPAQAAIIQPAGHTGTFLTDASGRLLIVHGINMINKFPPYDLASLGFGDEDAAMLQRMGLNAVRVGVIYAAVEPQPGKFDDAYLHSIAKTVAMLQRHGIMSLLDFHQDMFAALFKGEGLPNWSAVTDGLSLTTTVGFPMAYLRWPALQAAFDNLWKDRAGPGDIGLQERYAAAWAHVAHYFRHNSAILGYELINEPAPGSHHLQCIAPGGCAEFDRTALSTFTLKATRAIAAVDSTHFVFYEPFVTFDFGVATHEISPPGDRVGFAYHDYFPLNYSRPIDNALLQSETYGNPLLMTEFGATTTAKPVVTIADLMDRHMLSWFYWTYENRTPFNVVVAGKVTNSALQGIVQDLTRPRSGANVNEAVLTALSRPYPTAISGTPKGYGFDPSSRAFNLAFVPADSSVTNRETDVIVPPVAYPNGYEATASGCRIVSGRNAPILRILAVPQKTPATVHVRPN
jgi:endoglycosylceramidase